MFPDKQRQAAVYLQKKIFKADRFLVQRARVEGELEVHSHDFLEIAVVIEGRGIHYAFSGDQAIGPGDAFLLRPGAWHGYRGCQQLEVYNCCFSMSVLERELAWLREEPFLNYLFWAGPLSVERRGILAMHLSKEAQATCRSHLSALEQIVQVDGGWHKADLIGCLLCFLGELARSLGQPACKEGGGQRTHQAVLQGMQLLEEGLAQGWTLTVLAEAVSVDASYLVRLFKAATGLPPMAYLAHLRAERAAALLLHTDYPMMRIAEEVGWSDANYFARRFKAHFGLSATEYRARFNKRSVQSDMGQADATSERVASPVGFSASR